MNYYCIVAADFFRFRLIIILVYMSIKRYELIYTIPR
jgi:hypothetical protein